MVTKCPGCRLAFFAQQMASVFPRPLYLERAPSSVHDRDTQVSTSGPLSIAFCCEGEPQERWLEALAQCCPDVDLRVWPELGNAQDLHYAVFWKPPPGVFEALPSLKVGFSRGAGVDDLLDHPQLPPDLPVVRMNEPALTEGMSEYVLYQVLRFHRAIPEYERLRAARQWRELPQVRPCDRVVGVLGLGVLGRDAALKLAALDFDVHGWSRSPKQIEGVTCHSGQNGLSALLGKAQILVCLLPLTDETRGIIGSPTLDLMPAGSYVINCARGGHVDERALLEALDTGHIAGAALDVFEVEPLPRDHVLWAHPKVDVTPHVASLTNPLTAARSVVENIRRFEAGEPMSGVVDRSRGY